MRLEEPIEITDVIGRLQHVRKQGNGYVARCPGHEDRSPSLSVSVSEDGRVLLYCHAGCEFERVVEALGFEPKQLSPPRSEAVPLPARVAAPKPPALSDSEVSGWQAALREDAGAWAYVTEVLKFAPDVIKRLHLGLRESGGRRWLAYPYGRPGAWTFANCRSIEGEKAFRRYPAGQGTTLYGAELLEDGGVALLTEGERDAAAALTLGLDVECGGESGAAVVSMPGAEQIKIAAAALASQRLVYVCTDSDEAGERAAKAITEALGVEKVRRVRLEAFKDLGDLLSAKGSDEAQRLALNALRDARAYEAPATGTGTPLLTVDELFAPLPPVPWLCQALDLAPGAPALLAGYGFSGKTLAAQDLALAVATGTKAWGMFDVRKGRVLHLDYEQGAYLTRLRYQRLLRARVSRLALTDRARLGQSDRELGVIGVGEVEHGGVRSWFGQTDRAAGQRAASATAA